MTVEGGTELQFRRWSELYGDGPLKALLDEHLCGRTHVDLQILSQMTHEVARAAFYGGWLARGRVTTEPPSP